jgi:hypothetical protein
MTKPMKAELVNEPKLLSLDLQFFAEGDPDNLDPTNPDIPDPTNIDKKDEPKLFTQDEVNAFIKERVSRAEKKYEGFDDLKTFKEQADAQTEAERLKNLTEIDQAKEEARIASEKASNFETELAKLRETNKKHAINNEFIKQATMKKIAYLDDALVLASVDLSNIQVAEDGTVSGIDTIVDSLVKNKPFLLGTQSQDPKHIGGATDPVKQNDDVKTLSMQLDDAKKAKDFNLVVKLSNQLKNLTK